MKSRRALAFSRRRCATCRNAIAPCKPFSTIPGNCSPVEEQRVFACCSVFRGGFTREAAAEVAGASLSLLAALVDKSLLRRHLMGAMKSTNWRGNMRQPGSPTRSRKCRRATAILSFYALSPRAAEPNIRSGEQAAQWHEWVEIEHDNLRAALEWSLSGGELEPGLRIVGALWEFWMDRGYAPEGQSQAERFLARAEAAAPTRTYEPMALHTAGFAPFIMVATRPHSPGLRKRLPFAVNWAQAGNMSWRWR